MKVSKKLIFFLLGSRLIISFSFYAYQIVYTPNILVEKDNRLFLVEQGASFKDVQRELHEGGYIQDLISFSFLARITGYDEEIKPGRYVLQKNMTNLMASGY